MPAPSLALNAQPAFARLMFPVRHADAGCAAGKLLFTIAKALTSERNGTEEGTPPGVWTKEPPP
jgi:hypothetical protein